MKKQQKEQYKTLLMLVIGLSLIAWRFKLWYLITGAGAIFLAGVLSPSLLGLITDTWMWIGEKMGAVMSRIILSIVFLLFLTPIAILYRLFRKKTIENTESFFITRNHTYSQPDLEKVF